MYADVLRGNIREGCFPVPAKALRRVCIGEGGVARVHCETESSTSFKSSMPSMDCAGRGCAAEDVSKTSIMSGRCLGEERVEERSEEWLITNFESIPRIAGWLSVASSLVIDIHCASMVVILFCKRRRESRSKATSSGYGMRRIDNVGINTYVQSGTITLAHGSREQTERTWTNPRWRIGLLVIADQPGLFPPGTLRLIFNTHVPGNNEGDGSLQSTG